MAAAKVKTLAEQKRDLIARSDLYRQAMAGDIVRLERTLGWLPRTFALIRAASPLLVMASPLIGWVLAGRSKSKLPKELSKEKRAGKLARMWGIFRIAQQVVPFVHGFMKAWPTENNSPPPKPRQPVPSRRG